MNDYPPNESSKWLPRIKQDRPNGIYSFSDVFTILYKVLMNVF